MAVADAGSDSVSLQTQKDYENCSQVKNSEKGRRRNIQTSKSTKIIYDQAPKPGNGASSWDMKSIHFNISTEMFRKAGGD